MRLVATSPLIGSLIVVVLVMDHERGVLEKLTALREQASGAGISIEQQAALDAQMAGSLRGLMARVEAYPQLKASERALHETAAG